MRRCSCGSCASMSAASAEQRRWQRARGLAVESLAVESLVPESCIFLIAKVLCWCDSVCTALYREVGQLPGSRWISITNNYPYSDVT